MAFDLGPWRVRPELNSIVQGSRESHVSPKAMDVLVYLAERPGRVVSRDELFREVWAGSVVTDDALTRCIGEIRRAVDEDSRNPAFLETVPKRRYRVLAPVVWAPEDNPPAAKEALERATGRRPWKTGVGILAAAACVLAGLLLPHRNPPRVNGTNSIAVLPFLNLTGDPQQEYFADAITDELITELVHHGWMVVSRTSVMQYKSARQNMRRIATDLHVDTVLEGAVMRSGSRVRITAQLIDAKTDLHRWSGSFEGELSDVLQLQTDIARAVGSELKFALDTGKNAGSKPVRKIVPDSYDNYLKGLYFFRQAKFDTAASYFEQSAIKDSTNALAYAMLYEADAMSAFSSDLPVGDRALKAMRAALKLDPGMAEAHTDLGDLKFWWDWDWAAGENEFRRAVELDPYSLQAAVHYSTCLNALGRFEAAMMECKRGLRLDPVAQQINMAMLLVFVNTHRWQEALEQYRKMVELYPDRAQLRAIGGFVLSSLGKDPEALAAFLAADRLSNGTASRIAALERAASSDGLRGYWREHLRQLEEKAAHGRVPPTDFDQLYVTLGDKESAMRFLEVAYRERAPRLTWLKSSAVWDPLRSDPRFQALLSKMAFPE